MRKLFIIFAAMLFTACANPDSKEALRCIHSSMNTSGLKVKVENIYHHNGEDLYDLCQVWYATQLEPHRGQDLLVYLSHYRDGTPQLKIVEYQITNEIKEQFSFLVVFDSQMQPVEEMGFVEVKK